MPARFKPPPSGVEEGAIPSLADLRVKGKQHWGLGRCISPVIDMPARFKPLPSAEEEDAIPSMADLGVKGKQRLGLGVREAYPSFYQHACQV